MEDIFWEELVEYIFWKELVEDIFWKVLVEDIFWKEHKCHFVHQKSPDGTKTP